MSTVSVRLPRRLPLPSWTWLIAVLIVFSTAGPIVVVWPLLALSGVVALVMVVTAFLHPAFAVYVLLLTTPLLAGMNRGALFPGLRPNEALALLLGAAVLGRGLVQTAARRSLSIRVRSTDGALVLLVITGSVMPLFWLLARGESVLQDDLLYSMTLWKYYLLYLLVRSSIKTDHQVRRCLWVSMASGAVVGIIGILQALGLFGVSDLLATYYAPGGDTEALYLSRASSTLAHPQAMADVMVMNLAIAVAWVARARSHRWILVPASVLFLVASLASGQFSGLIALFAGMGALALLTRQLRRKVFALVPAVVLAGLLLTPVIEERLTSISPSQGLPTSWVARIENLETYVLPELSKDFSYALGVRPSARIPKSAGTDDGYVFIESGHAWLLWIGGIPFLVAFIVFVSAQIRTTARIAQHRFDGVSVAATASFTGLVVLAVVTTFDPHLTLRGAADLNFSLLALAHVGLRNSASVNRGGGAVEDRRLEAGQSSVDSWDPRRMGSGPRQRSTRTAQV